jgi:OmpA-OmpF porin, OOP family
MVTLNVVFTQRGCGFFPKRRTMKKLNKVALLFASTALLAGCGVMSTSAPGGSRVVAANGGTVLDNWVNGTGEYVWRNGTNELCWRDANWTPATAAVGCDGALVRAAAVVPPPPPPPPPPLPVPPPPQSLRSATQLPVSESVVPMLPDSTMIPPTSSNARMATITA